MSAPAALRGVSHKDAMRKTVRMLTRSGIDVQFRGFAPRVETRGDKVIRMVLPEVADDASKDLIDALNGYIDHECGHVFYTPFSKFEKISRGNRILQSMLNIIEDIRLEKLLPRDLPGTKENLARMYENFIPKLIAPNVDKSIATGNPSKQFAGVMVPALRALAGQKAFQKYMDDNGHWQYFAPLIAKMPNLSRRLRDMETYKDVLDLTNDILKAIEEMGVKSDPKPPEPQKPQNDPDEDEGDESPSDQDDGEGHGDGEGTDDGEGDDDDEGDCAGSDSDEPGDEEGDGEGDEEGEDKGDNSSESDPEDRDSEGKPSDTGKDTGEQDKDGKGKANVSITDALKQLEPTQRRAMYLYKKRKLSIADIAQETMQSEEQVKDLLVVARRRLKEIMNGG